MTEEPALNLSPEGHERHRQAAYLYSIIQSAEESEGGGPNDDIEAAYDAGIMYAARMVLDNEAGDNDWPADLYEYADEIRSRTEPGTPLPARMREVVAAAIEWREMVLDSPPNHPRVAIAQRALIGAVDALEGE